MRAKGGTQPHAQAPCKFQKNAREPRQRKTDCRCCLPALAGFASSLSTVPDALSMACSALISNKNCQSNALGGKKAPERALRSHFLCCLREGFWIEKDPIHKFLCRFNLLFLTCSGKFCPFSPRFSLPRVLTLRTTTGPFTSRSVPWESVLRSISRTRRP